MWAQVINSALGIWLMAAPAILGFNKSIANNDYIVGPLIATFAITAIFENTRNVRRFNWLPGAWLLLAPWVLDYDSTTATLNDMLTGALVIAFSFVKGEVKSELGGGWSSLWKDPSPRGQETGRPE